MRLLLLSLVFPLFAVAQPHPHVDVPSWSVDAVWYQIFPERFRNGDPTNDPTPASLVGSWPHVIPQGWQPTPWTSDWYAMQPWEAAAGRNFYTMVQTRRYGGDLQGVIDRLDYLDSLGITAIYFNPIFDAPSLHKYDGATFHHIDVHFGPDPEGDRALIAQENPLDPSTWVWTSADRLFLTLLQEAKARGIRVVLDGVFNHMGLRSFAYQSLEREGRNSPFAHWFTVQEWDDPATPDTNELRVAGWIGVRELPELAEDDHGWLPDIEAYVFHSVRRWMDPNGDGDPSDGIDGWRLDVAEMVSLHAWQRFRTHVRSINPEAYIVGEVWWDRWPLHMFNAIPWLQGDAFDAVMNYRWGLAARRLFLGSDLNPGEAYGPTHFFAHLDSLRSEYPETVNFGLMNTISSHDTERLASQVVNPHARFDAQSGVAQHPTFHVRAPNAAERNTQRLMLVQQFTYIGAPHLFYGDEAGMWGADDPDDRKPMVWPELTYDTERQHPHGLERPADPVAFDHELFAFYRHLIHLRRNEVALRRGSFTPLLANDGQRVLAYERRIGEELVVVAFNLGEEAASIALDVNPTLPQAGHTVERTFNGRVFYDALSDTQTVLENGQLRFDLAPQTARVWTLRPHAR